MTRLRVASYNLRGFHDDRQAAARIVRAIDPDILCVQEAPRWFARRRVRRFAAECGLVWDDRMRGSGGTAIFTSPRVTLLYAERNRLPFTREAERRGFAFALVRLPGGRPIAVASVHLSLTEAARLIQIRRILARVSRAGTPTLLAGDLNETSDAPAWRLVTGGMRLVSPLAATFPARSPRRMIDGVFASPEFAAVPQASLALTSADLLAATDHLPIWADLTIRD